MLSLIRFGRLNFESHVAALILAVIAGFLSYISGDNESILAHVTTGLVGMVCWYIYKVFDGITYDNEPTAYSSIAGIVLIIGLCLWHFF
jgi:uncharacterized membrane protein